MAQWVVETGWVQSGFAGQQTVAVATPFRKFLGIYGCNLTSSVYIGTRPQVAQSNGITLASTGGGLSYLELFKQRHGMIVEANWYAYLPGGSPNPVVITLEWFDDGKPSSSEPVDPGSVLTAGSLPTDSDLPDPAHDLIQRLRTALDAITQRC